ncbi:MAG: peptidoglycan-binding protein [Bacteroidales bacterium]|nr:peptidoglycan-binding protein [Bacteroidales bacterium]
MKKANKKRSIVLIMVAILSMLGLGILIVVLNRKKLKGESSVQHVASAVSSTVRGGSYVAESFPLKKGMKGDNVKALQYGLMKLGFSVGVGGTDGLFGNDTLKGVRQYYGNNSKESVSYEEWKPFYTLYSVDNNLPQAVS